MFVQAHPVKDSGREGCEERTQDRRGRDAGAAWVKQAPDIGRMSSWEWFATKKQAALTVRALTKVACPVAAENGTTAFVSGSWTDYLGWDEVIVPPERCEHGRSGLGSSSGKGAWAYATCATFRGDGESAFEDIAPLSRRAGVIRCGLPTWCSAE